MGPTFLGIGAQKCGTSWLYRNLAAHPEVWLPPEKELHFFDERLDSELGLLSRIAGRSDEAVRWRRQVRRQFGKFREGRTDRSHIGWYARYFLGRADEEWYRALFSRAGERVSGDITPDYSVLDEERIRRAASVLGPDGRLIFLVRSPIERLWSHAKMEERILDVDASRAVEDLLERRRARRLTDYLATIDRWTRHFPPERLFLGYMEDVAITPAALLDGLCAFLGVSPQDEYPAAEQVVHRGGHQTLPTETAVRLAKALRPELRDLDERLGGHARWWRFAGDQLVEDPPEADEVVYPLWASELRERWRTVAGEPEGRTLTSGPLAAPTPHP